MKTWLGILTQCMTSLVTVEGKLFKVQCTLNNCPDRFVVKRFRTCFNGFIASCMSISTLLNKSWLFYSCVVQMNDFGLM